MDARDRPLPHPEEEALDIGQQTYREVERIVSALREHGHLAAEASDEAVALVVLDVIAPEVPVAHD